VLGAVKAASLRSAATVRGDSGLDCACAQRVVCICVTAVRSTSRSNSGIDWQMIRYIELKSGYHDDGPAWIARVLVSKSGRTVYFDGKALKRTTQGASGNYFDVETAESYWVSGVKKKGGDRHRAGRGKITIDAGAIDEYLQITGATELDPSRFVVSTAIEPPDAKKFHDLENQSLKPPDGAA
jgi:hypothetical protein